MRRKSPVPCASHQQSGYVLLAVVSILTVAATLAIIATSNARLDASLARASVSTAQVRAGIEAGVARALFLLGEPNALVADGRVLAFQLDDLDIKVRLVADQGLVGLNSADEVFLEQVLSSVVSKREAVALAQAILDWRDADNDPRPVGAEARFYARQGLMEPGNRPFVHIVELRRVIGIDDTIFAAIAPLFSVSTNNIKPDENFAPLVILELLDLLPSELEEILRRRDADQPLPQDEPTPDADENAAQTTARIPILHAFVEVQATNGAARAERMRIEFDTDNNRYRLYGRHVIDYGSSDILFERNLGQ